MHFLCKTKSLNLNYVKSIEGENDMSTKFIEKMKMFEWHSWYC